MRTGSTINSLLHKYQFAKYDATGFLMLTCGFLTMQNEDGIACHESAAIHALKNIDWSVDYVPWHTETDYSRYDVIVVRSTWDYVDDITSFLQCLEQIVKSGTCLENPLKAIQWNIDKRYLKNLESEGISTIPTHYAEDWSDALINDLHDLWSSPKLVIKPTVGASARDTFIIHHSNYPKIKQLYHARPLMIQPFVPTICTHGELSLIYFDGKLSHAIKKMPTQGDFRVQARFGGKVELTTPELPFVDLAEKALRSLNFDTLYARVDMVWFREQPAIMEIELIEPALYLEYDEPAARCFAEAIHTRHLRRTQNSQKNLRS